MDPIPIPLQPVKLDEAELTIARQFFQDRTGQRLLQSLRYFRPSVTSKRYDNRRTEMERRLGYEECIDMLLLLMRPKEQPRQE